MLTSVCCCCYCLVAWLGNLQKKKLRSLIEGKLAVNPPSDLINFENVVCLIVTTRERSQEGILAPRNSSVSNVHLMIRDTVPGNVKVAISGNGRVSDYEY
jgi:hypothetical protein